MWIKKLIQGTTNLIFAQWDSQHITCNFNNTRRATILTYHIKKEKKKDQKPIPQLKKKKKNKKKLLNRWINAGI